MENKNSFENLDTNELERFCSEANSKVLAAYVVVYRTLHIHQNLAKVCMAELSKRAANGDDFDYEKYIEEKSNQIPKPMEDDKQSLWRKLFTTDLKKI